MDKEILLANIDKVHTTKMGVDRIKKNLKLDIDNVVEYCKNKVLDKNCNIYKKGKNWYCEIDNIRITINSYSYTIITAHTFSKKIKEVLIVKVITVCGSYKFKKEMVEIAEKMTLEGNCMIMPNDLTKTGKDSYTEDEILMIDKMHKEKIRISDAILVVDVNGYIGNSTKSEIEYAKSLNKEILYYTNLMKK